jgi:hypothetical protein
MCNQFCAGDSARYSVGGKTRFRGCGGVRISSHVATVAPANGRDKTGTLLLPVKRHFEKLTPFRGHSAFLLPQTTRPWHCV